MRADLRESLKGWAADLAVTTTIGVFLAVLGPFGTFFNGPLPQRLAYWVGMAWCGTLLYGSAVRLILARRWTPGGIRIALALTVLLATAPFGLFTYWIASSLWPVLREVEGLSAPIWYAQCLMIAAPQVALFYAAHRRRRARAVRPSPAPASGGLLGARPAEVICLAMEDHYVRVHTAAGSSLILATMSQAVAALGGAPGLQTHRSWWVAGKAVVGAVTEGRNLRLRLVNGLTAPVARASVAAVRAAGWLEP